MKNLKLEVSFDRLQWWRDLEDRILPLETVLAAQVKLLEALQVIDNRHIPLSSTKNSKQLVTPAIFPQNFFKSRQTAIGELSCSAAILQKRIHGVLALVSCSYAPLLPYNAPDQYPAPERSRIRKPETARKDQ
jgi:hypothetical protein